MPVKEVAEGLGRQALRQLRRSRTAAKAISFDDYVKGLNPKTIQNLNVSQTSRNGDLSPEQVQLMRDEWAKDRSKGMDFLDEYEEGTLDGNWHNFRGHLSESSRQQKIDADTSRLQNGKNIELEPTPIEQAPTRYDVEGVEGRRGVEQAARPWFDEQLERIGWDPKRTGEIDRSQFANEGIYVDGEKYNFSGLTKYAKDRKSFPKLRPAAKSASKLDRASNELVQTFGPSVRAKPQLVDALGEIVPEKDVHQHHVLLLKVIEPWTRKADGSTRDKRQLKELFRALSKRDWWTGNVDKNLVWQSVGTHFGDPKSSHGLLKSATDIQGRGKGELDIPGKTYDPKAMHGFSNEFIANLSKETNTKKLIKSLLIFLEEAGGGEAMEGAAYSASKNLEPRAKIKGTDVVSGDVLADRRLKNPRVKKNVERFEKGVKDLKKDKK